MKGKLGLKENKSRFRRLKLGLKSKKVGLNGGD